MGDAKHDVGTVLRFLASGGWADQDPDVSAELMQQAHELALAVVADEGAAPSLRAQAQAFLDRLDADTLQ